VTSGRGLPLKLPEKSIMQIKHEGTKPPSIRCQINQFLPTFDPSGFDDRNHLPFENGRPDQPLAFLACEPGGVVSNRAFFIGVDASSGERTTSPFSKI